MYSIKTISLPDEKLNIYLEMWSSIREALKRKLAERRHILTDNIIIAFNISRHLRLGLPKFC